MRYQSSLYPWFNSCATRQQPLINSVCLSRLIYIMHYVHNSSLFSYAFSFRGILIQIYENCDDLCRRKTVIFLNSCRMCCACFALHCIALHYSAHSPLELFSDLLHQVLRSSYLINLDYLSLQQLRYYFPKCVYPILCQLSLWEETGADSFHISP
jgi:hypothetical protein